MLRLKIRVRLDFQTFWVNHTLLTTNKFVTCFNLILIKKLLTEKSQLTNLMRYMSLLIEHSVLIFD